MAHRASRRYAKTTRGFRSSKNGRYTRIKRNKKGQFTRKNRK